MTQAPNPASATTVGKLMIDSHRQQIRRELNRALGTMVQALEACESALKGADAAARNFDPGQEHDAALQMLKHLTNGHGNAMHSVHHALKLCEELHGIKAAVADREALERAALGGLA